MSRQGQGSQSRPDGYPPAGVSRPTGSGYQPTGRRNSQYQDVAQAMKKAADRESAGSDQGPARSPFPVKKASRPVRTPKSAPKGIRLPADIPDSVPLKNRRRRGAGRREAEFQSADGNSYRFQKASYQSKTPVDIATDLSLCALLCIIEQMKGGDPLDVLEAYGVRISDVSGEPYFDYQDADFFRSQRAESATFDSGLYTEEDDGYEGVGSASLGTFVSMGE